jgi:hypothetical protein
MGVPSANKDNDCVSFHFLFSDDPELTWTDCDVIPRAFTLSNISDDFCDCYSAYFFHAFHVLHVSLL